LGNVGEIDEPRIIEKLISLKNTNVKPIGYISSVASYDGNEFFSGTTSNFIKKAPTRAKRDVIINGRGYSLKSTRAAPPAIVNHTTRDKWIRICNVLGEKIDLLDDMVSDYWALRENKKIGEDITVVNYNCPFGNTIQKKQYLKKLINYFLFEGTGSRTSKYPAQYIIEFSNPINPQTWKVLDKNTAFDSMWNKMIFSLRADKGMPPDYENMKDLQKKTLIEPWVKFIDGDYRGALHIRTKRK
jgi:hypothetical protein